MAMGDSLNIRSVTVELLRSGPSHNQLLSPLTLYLGICDEAEAGIVTLPFEHSAFLRRIGVMRYEEHKAADKLPELRALGVEMARVLGAIPRLPGSLSAESAGRDTLVHLSLVLSASELALLPFELAKMPIGPTAWTESWMALQSRVPVVITRRTRNVAPRDAPWLKQPRILFISAETDPTAPHGVPYPEHRLALIKAVRPFMMPSDREVKISHGGEREQFGQLLTILKKPRFEDVVAECAAHRYTCIHVLAHGREDRSMGDSSYGLELHPRDGVISGERLASAFTALHNGRIHRPDVVTLATCDSGNNESAVLTPGASIAHVLHQAGVPLVVASQFPLSKVGSVLVARLFYSGLMWGDNPWVLLHRVRTNLHGVMGPGDHDWASLVVYEALRLDAYKLDQTCFHQCYQAMLAAWMDDDGNEDELAVIEDEQAAKASAVAVCMASRVIPRLPVDSKYFGMRALALRADAHLQNAIDHLGTVNRALRRQNERAEYEDRVARSCRELELSIDDHEAALMGFLVRDGQGMNAPYRSLVGLLRLRIVLGLQRESDAGIWETAFFWLRAVLSQSPSADDKVSAWGCLAEMWLLRTLHPEDNERRRAAVEALKAAAEVTRLDRGGETMTTRWMRVLLDTYIRFWGDKRFEQALVNFGDADRPSFRTGEINLVDTARRMREILDRQGQGQGQGLRQVSGQQVPSLHNELKRLSKGSGRMRHKPPVLQAYEMPSDAEGDEDTIEEATDEHDSPAIEDLSDDSADGGSDAAEDRDGGEEADAGLPAGADPGCLGGRSKSPARVLANALSGTASGSAGANGGLAGDLLRVVARKRALPVARPEDAGPEGTPAGNLSARQTKPAAQPGPGPSQGRNAVTGKATRSKSAASFFHLDMLPARHGDALWIEYGRGAGTPARILVDCGPPGAYKQHLKPRLEALPPGQRHFELFILSHIDDDHIGGAIELLKGARRLGLTFGDIWFNGFRHLPGVLNAKQGEVFSALLVQLKLPWNRMVRDWQPDDADAVAREADELPEIQLPGGMRLTLLSPTPVQLAALRRSWVKEIEGRGLTPGEQATGERFLGKVPLPPTLENVPALAAEKFESDNTAANGSSIAVLAEFDDKSVLLGADAYAPVLEQAIDLLRVRRKLKKDQPLPLSTFKLPHHASQNNLSTSLLKKLRCSDFLVSTSGARFNHPDSQAISRVLMQGLAAKLPARLWFNYRASVHLNGAWDDAALKRKYNFETFYPENAEGGIRYTVPDFLKP